MREESEEPEDREVEDMQERSEKLQKEIEETRADWEAKKSDVTAPGAQDGDED
jgi:DNA-binding protein YbaB